MDQAQVFGGMQFQCLSDTRLPTGRDTGRNGYPVLKTRLPHRSQVIRLLRPSPVNVNCWCTRFAADGRKPDRRANQTQMLLRCLSTKWNGKASSHHDGTSSTIKTNVFLGFLGSPAFATALRKRKPRAQHPPASAALNGLQTRKRRRRVWGGHWQQQVALVALVSLPRKAQATWRKTWDGAMC